MPNTFADIILYSWPIMVFILFQRLPLQEALVWAIVAGYLLLPLRTGFDLPVLPAIDKDTVPALSALVMCFLCLRQASATRAATARAKAAGSTRHLVISSPISFDPIRGQRFFWLLMVMLFAGPFFTVLVNSQPIFQDGQFLVRGLNQYDALSMNSNTLFSLIPFFLARRFLNSEEAHKVILKVIVIAAICYSFLVFYEARMSPQLNRTIYGFFPHSFVQHMRSGGFRPLVFLNHGLWLAIFLALSVLAAFSMYKLMPSGKRVVWFLSGLWLFVTLFVMKSLGALALTLIFVPAILLLGRKMQILIVACVAVFVLLFPFARSSGLVPTDTIYNLAHSIDPARAQSLNFRLKNEDLLLDKANQKSLFGWGGWGRGRVYNEQGNDISTTDGYWIIIKGAYGWAGYLARFALLCVPVIILGVMRNRLKISHATTGLAMALSIGLIDLIPNGTISPVLWLIAGAVMGHYQTAPTIEAARAPTRNAPAPRRDAPLSPELRNTPAAISKTLHKRRPRKS